MKRTTIYLTRLQDSRLKKLSHQLGGVPVARLIRDAIEAFLKAQKRGARWIHKSNRNRQQNARAATVESTNKPIREAARHVRTGKKLPATEENWAQAEKFLKHRLGEITAEKHGGRAFLGPASEKIRVSELLDGLESFKREHGRANPQTLSAIRPIRAHFGEMRAAEVTADHVRRYSTALLKSGFSVATRNRRLQLLGQAYRLAIKEKRLTELPLITLLPETGNARQGFTTRPQLDRVLANLPEDLRDVVLFAFLSSWRRGEILSLRWENVTPDCIRLTAPCSKEREARSLALEGELAEVIEHRRLKANGPLVFHRDGAPIIDFRKSWATATRLAGCPGLLLHDLRRAGVRDMIRSGVSPIIAMTISGHKTDSMLRRYAIISEADQRAALRRTEEFRKTEIEAVARASQVVQ
jgi:integrase